MNMRVAQITNTVSGNTALPQLDYAALVAAGVVVPEFEDDAYADFCFDLGDSRSLQSRVSGPKLTPANTVPAYGSGFLTVQSGGLNGLISPLSDVGSKTVVAIVKRPTNPTAVAVISQSAQTGAGDDNGFFTYFTSAGYVSATLRTAGTDTFLNIAGVAAGTSVGDWIFTALTETKNVDGTYDDRLWVGLAGGPLSSVAAGVARRESSRAVAFGNAYDATTNYAERAVPLHRGLLYRKALTTDELAGLYARSKILAARRGITIV